MKYTIIQTTCTNTEEAKKITATLLEKKLAACIQSTAIKSNYLWNDTLECESEILLSIKTKAIHFEAIETLITQLHSYEVPEIIAIEIQNASSAYLAWIEESVI